MKLKNITNVTFMKLKNITNATFTKRKNITNVTFMKLKNITNLTFMKLKDISKVIKRIWGAICTQKVWNNYFLPPTLFQKYWQQSANDDFEESVNQPGDQCWGRALPGCSPPYRPSLRALPSRLYTEILERPAMPACSAGTSNPEIG